MKIENIVFRGMLLVLMLLLPGSSFVTLPLPTYQGDRIQANTENSFVLSLPVVYR